MLIVIHFFHLTCHVLFVFNFNIVIENKGFKVKLTKIKFNIVYPIFEKIHFPN